MLFYDISGDIFMASSYTLGSHFEGFVKNMVQSGRYASASEVMRDGLRLIEEREDIRKAKLQALQNDIQAGLDSSTGDALDMNEIKTFAREQRLKSHIK
jgi:antitoxin ParD1/3/4